jgi:hypothetical protein
LLKWDEEKFGYYDMVYNQGDYSLPNFSTATLKFSSWDDFENNLTYAIRKDEQSTDAYMKNKKKEIVSINRKDKINKIVQ